MSSKLDAIRQRLEWGERIKAVRESLSLSQEAFGALLAERLKRHGVSAAYPPAKISKLESGERKLSVEEAVILLDLGKGEFTGTWLVFGDAKPSHRRGEPRERRVG